MRTTIRLDDHLFAETKKFAAENGKTLTAVIEGALREVLARRRPENKRAPVRLKPWKGGHGVQPGVDLNNSAALLDLMDEWDAAHRR